MSANDAIWICAQSGVTPVAIGMPGVGKSAIHNAFAQAVNRSMYTLIGSIRDPADIGGYPYPDHVEAGGQKHAMMRLIPPKWAIDAWDGTPWIIFLDELTTVPPATQAAMLRVISEKYVGDTALPENTWILAAANPPSQAANGVDLEPPMANRVCHLTWTHDEDSWLEGMMNNQQFPAPKFPVLPEDWRAKHLGHASALIVAFLRKRRDLIAAFPEKSREQACKAWPSPRSWTNAATARAAALSVNAEAGVQFQLVEGCVGLAAAKEYDEWARNLDLPEPEELIEMAIKSIATGKPMKYKHPDRPDKVIAMLSSLAHTAVNDRPSKERWEAALKVFLAAAKVDADIALSCMKPLAANPPKGAKLDGEFQAMFPLVRRALISKS